MATLSGTLTEDQLPLGEIEDCHLRLRGTHNPTTAERTLATIKTPLGGTTETLMEDQPPPDSGSALSSSGR